MPHPRNKRERSLIGKRKGEKRAKGETGGWTWETFSEEEKQERLRIWSYRRRDTTKICSCHMCGNPRRVEWNKKDKLTMQERKLEKIEELDPGGYKIGDSYVAVGKKVPNADKLKTVTLIGDRYRQHLKKMGL